MITPREIAYSIFGAWRLARFDPGGMQHFDTSIEGFWRSFFAAAIVAPAYVVLVALQGSPAAEGNDWLRYPLVEVISYAVRWTAWPLAMFYICKPIRREPRYTAYIVAYNWAQVIGTGFFVLVVVLANGLLAPGSIGTAIFVTTMVLLVYQWFVARTALEIGGGLAAGLVVLDLILTVIIGSTALRLGGAMPTP